jgi:hypothetical protein
MEGQNLWCGRVLSSSHIAYLNCKAVDHLVCKLSDISVQGSLSQLHRNIFVNGFMLVSDFQVGNVCAFTFVVQTGRVTVQVSLEPIPYKTQHMQPR